MNTPGWECGRGKEEKKVNNNLFTASVGNSFGLGNEILQPSGCSTQITGFSSSRLIAVTMMHNLFEKSTYCR